jgi:hypothetical protein
MKDLIHINTKDYDIITQQAKFENVRILQMDDNFTLIGVRDNLLGRGVLRKILINNREIKYIKGEFKDPPEESKVPPKTDI